MENFCLSPEILNRAKKPDHISFSSFKLYNQCPYKFYLMKVVNVIPYVANEHTIIGSGVHGVLEHVFTCKKNGDKIKSTEFLDVYRLTAEEEIQKSEKDGNPLSQTQLERVFSVDSTFLKNVVSNVLFDIGEVAEDFVIEEQVNYPLDFLVPGTDITFEFYIDLHYKKYNRREIRDWKTASKLWGEDKKGDFWGVTAQLLYYKYFLHRITNIPPQDIATIYSIFKKTKAYRVEHWEAKYTQGQLKALLERTKDMVESCEKMEFPRTYKCVDFAGYQGPIMCPAHNNKELCDGCRKFSQTV